MKKINWEGSRKDAVARVGCVIMYCNTYRHNRKNSKPYLLASVSVQQRSGTFTTGEKCKSMTAAKEDAVRIARELLLDHYVCLQAEMANFDLVE